MTPEQYKRLMSAFDRACSLGDADQARVVDELRASDPSMASELAMLLAKDRADDGPLADRALAAAPHADLPTGETSKLPPGHRAIERVKEGAAAPADTVVGGRYWLDDCIGAGGNGRVYRARDLRTDQVVAVKLLRANLNQDFRQIQRFRREFRAIARIDHPGILSVFDEGVHEGERFLVMEYVPGGTLERLTQAPARILFPVLTRVAIALDCIHSRNIIHRDLKPANVLLAAGDPPVPKLADFGIVKLLDDADGMTESGAVLGTIDYVSPEAIDGQAVDPRSDLYSLGCTIYKLWTGRPPFEGTTYNRLRSRYEQDAPPLREFATDAPAALEALVARLLDRVPARRPQRAAAVARELADIWQQIDDSADTTNYGNIESATKVFLYRPRFVGRDRDVEDILTRVVNASRATNARLIALSGQGGLGKTALIQHVSAKLTQQGYRVLVVDVLGGTRTPFDPFPAVLREAEKLLADPVNAEDNQSLGGATGRPTRARMRLKSDDAVVSRRRLARRIAEALLRAHQRERLVLVIENLHRAETSALSLIEELLNEIDTLSAERPVIVATMRPAGRTRLDAELRQLERVEFVSLSPLTGDAVEEIATTMLATATASVPPVLLSRLPQLCGGNPLLVQSALRDLVDRGHLRLRGSSWSLTTNELDVVVNRAVGDVLRARLAGLSEPTRAILAVAALCGRIFDLDLVSRASGAEEDAVLDAFDEAIRAAVLEERPGTAERYGFEHDRLAEAVRDDLGDDHKSRYHRAIGLVLERREGSSPATLAFHFARGRDSARAILYSREAGVANAAAGDYAAAVDHLRAALHNVDGLPEDEQEQRREEIIELLADAFLASGRARDSISHLAQLSQLPAVKPVRARRLHKFGLALVRTGDVSQGIVMLKKALTLLDDQVPRQRVRRIARIIADAALAKLRRLFGVGFRYRAKDELRAIIHRELGLIHRWIDIEACAAHQVAFVRLAYRIGITSFLIEAHVGTSFLYSLRSNLKQAKRHRERAIKLARRSNNMAGLAIAELGHGATQCLIGNGAHEALRHFDKALRIAEEHGDRFLINFVLTQRGWGIGVLGHSQHAADDFRRASALAEELDVDCLRQEAACGRALMEVFHGKLEESAAAARAVLASDLRMALPVFEGLANEILAVESLVSGRFFDARAYYDRAWSHYQAHRLDDSWGLMTRIGIAEARLSLADEQGEEVVPDLVPKLREAARSFRRLSALPPLRGMNLFIRGLQRARRGDRHAAARLFEQARTARGRGTSPAYVDTWCSAREALECHRLGLIDEREARRQLDRVDDSFAHLQLDGMRAWLIRLRTIYRLEKTAAQ